MKILIENGQVFDSKKGIFFDASVGVADGRVLFVGSRLPQFVPDRVINAEGGIVSPGFVDLHTRLCEPGDEHKGTIESETRAAVRGGFTHVCCPPDTRPVNDTEAVTRLILDLAARANQAKVLPLGALTQGLKGEQLSEIYSLRAAGCVAVTNGTASLRNAKVLRRCMEYARTHDICVFARPEDAALAADGCINEGRISARLGLVGLPEIAEVIAVSQWILLAEETGVRLHLAQISCAKTLELVQQARARGVRLTCDVAIHHLLATDEATDHFDSRFHLRPPLRTERDRCALLAGVNDGSIDAICSQHTPHEEAAIKVPFAESMPGIAGIETLLPLLLTLVEAGELQLDKALVALTYGPAAVLGMACGVLEQGAAADMVVFSRHSEKSFSASGCMTRGVNNPWLDRELVDPVMATLVDGRLVYQA